MPDNNKNKSPYVADDTLAGKKPNIQPNPPANIGIDTTNSFYNTLATRGANSVTDLSSLTSLPSTAQNRDQIYNLIDMMGEDSTIAAVLETYAEDATEYNENNKIVWATADDPKIEYYLNNLLQKLNVDRNIYGWMLSLFKYGDIYLRLFRESDCEKDGLFDDEDDNKNKKQTNSEFKNNRLKSLEEQYLAGELDTYDPSFNANEDDEELNEAMDINVKAYSKKDKYLTYLEMVANPAEMFELVKNGETKAYIKTNLNSLTAINTGTDHWIQDQNFMRYRPNKNGTTIYQATEFVHGYLATEGRRTEEEMELFVEDTDKETKDPDSYVYKVRHGQSILYNTFKVWRELQLMEDSMLLNRVTRSSLVRVIGVEVGDSDPVTTNTYIEQIKSMMEQKSAVNVGTSMQSYTNPGPVENNVYIPTRNGMGVLSPQEIGGQVNVGAMGDVDYFRNKLFGSLKVPKQYFGYTDENAGFSGGQSLSIISSRYAKTIMKGQVAMMQTLTDALNLLLINRGKGGYIYHYTLHMVPPTTQHDLDRTDITDKKLNQTRTFMDMIGDNGIGCSTREQAEILKSLSSAYLNNPDVLAVLQEYIDELEKQEAEEANGNGEEEGMEEGFGGPGMFNESEGGEPAEEPEPIIMEDVEDINLNFETLNEEGAEEELPTPEDLGIDFTDPSNFN